jgi:hypothetical protein
MKVEFRLMGSSRLAIREIIGCINASGLTINVVTTYVFVPAGGELARILILGER